MGKSLQLRRQPKPGAEVDEPFCRVVLIPLDPIAVVNRELVVEVVVSLPGSDDGRKKVVAGGVLVVKWGVAKGVGEGVDAHDAVLDDRQPEHGRVADAACPVTPEVSCYCRWHDVGQEGEELEVVTVLEHDELVLLEVGDVCGAGLDVSPEEDPAGVRPPEAFFSGVGVEVRVGVAVVGAMLASPPEGRALDAAGTADEEENLEGGGGFEGAVGVESVGAGS